MTVLYPNPCNNEKCYKVTTLYIFLFVSFDSICPSQQFFQLCQDGSSWVEPVLSKNKCVLLKDTTQ